MGPQDGLELLLESIDSIVHRSKRQDILFVLIGAGTEVPRLKALAADKGLDSLVRFPGHLSDQEVAAYFSTAEVGVAPDPATPMNDKSTMNKILEYMAFGLPVVIYDLTEGRRSAAGGALYARTGDAEDFARQILRILDSETLRRELGACGRRRIEESLNWESEKRSLLEAYATALGNKL
jgi:glycosyltransferase involved in cell wall biosynthesis